ncbi:MAG: squalene/phytoene synthase family protein [Erythrobacter sp.]
MANETPDNHTAEAQLALAYTPPEVRDALRIFLEFDARLARIVAGTSEPILGQMRLAWWRDVLAEPRDRRPGGDAVLDGIGRHWEGREKALIALVDGWENMLAERLDQKAADGFADGRSAGLAAIAGESEERGVVAQSARRWALVDAAVHLPPGEERDLLLDLARAVPQSGRLPRHARGIAVLGALATRALKRGGRPLVEGRGAAITAIRAAIFRR